MGLGDDLDQVFDQLLVPGTPQKPSAINPNAAVGPGNMRRTRSEVLAHGQLVKELVKDQSKPLVVLASLINTCTRAYVLAALHGAISYVMGIERQGRRRDRLDSLQSLLSTKRGGIRKRLSVPKERALVEGLMAFGSTPDAADLTALEHYLRATEVQIDINLEDVSMLFAAGLWHPQQITSSPIEEIVAVSGIALKKANALKTLLA